MLLFFCYFGRTENDFFKIPTVTNLFIKKQANYNIFEPILFQFLFSVGELQEAVAPAHGERQRRVTCDLMSVSTPIGSLNHAACAAHCLSMGGGRRGGSCQNGVCVCRF